MQVQAHSNYQLDPGTGDLTEPARTVPQKIFIDSNDNKYIYAKLIARGGFSDVFLATSYNSGHNVAIKEIWASSLDPKIWKPEIQSFIDEKLPILLKLSHENVVRYHGAGSRTDSDLQEACAILVMEYCPGEKQLFWVFIVDSSKDNLADFFMSSRKNRETLPNKMILE